MMTSIQSNPDVLFPLNRFYETEHLALPKTVLMAGADLPEPYRGMLDHDRDMTPTLEAFHDSRIHLELVKKDHRGGFYFREVILRLDRDEKPVEFGANKLHIGIFSEEAQEQILLEQVPLGRILKECGVRHVTEAKFFLRVEPDELICRALELESPVTLYGRKAVISDHKGLVLSEIVEILPQSAVA